jgi:hypothetical protein
MIRAQTGRLVCITNHSTIIMGVIFDMFKAQLEELKRRDDELNRDIQDTLKRCDVLLDKLSKLDKE